MTVTSGESPEVCSITKFYHRCTIAGIENKNTSIREVELVVQQVVLLCAMFCYCFGKTVNLLKRPLTSIIADVVGKVLLQMLPPPISVWHYNINYKTNLQWTLPRLLKQLLLSALMMTPYIMNIYNTCHLLKASGKLLPAVYFSLQYACFLTSSWQQFCLLYRTEHVLSDGRPEILAKLLQQLLARCIF